MKFLFTTAIVLSLASGAFAADKQLWAKSVIDQPAPELKVEKWLTPEPQTKGKFVLIDFWATWCGPCRATIPELNGYQQKYRDKLVVIGVSDEAPEKVAEFAAPKIEYSSAIDTQARTKKQLEVTGIPHLILVDPRGIVRWEGFPFLAGHELNDAVLQNIFAKYGDTKKAQNPKSN